MLSAISNSTGMRKQSLSYLYHISEQKLEAIGLPSFLWILQLAQACKSQNIS